MKVIGTDGMTVQDIRHEIDRGARFVIYAYAISLLVVTFKRASSIYFLKPGDSGLGKGLPFSLLTLLLGWWGFPWGPIYSIASFIQNFKGGKDITNEMLASLG